MAVYNPPISSNIPPSPLHTISSVIILDNEGRHLISRHFSASKHSDASTPAPSDQTVSTALSDQHKLEHHIWDVTRRRPLGQVAIIDGMIIVYKTNLDIMLFVIGRLDCNELMLGTVLDSIYEAMEALIKYHPFINYFFI
jgi:coatomer subunit zeta